MPPKRRRKKKQKKRYHILLILLVIAAITFFYFEEPGRDSLPSRLMKLFRHVPEKRQVEPPVKKPAVMLPKVALVIDDLGPNKKMAMSVLVINAPLTLSILPQEVYSAWIAEEGHRMGREVIVHIPMEATRPLRLGKGGLFTWMTDDEIIQTVREDIRSVPYAIGASSHMGSAFTQDERAIKAVVSELKKQGFFFLDSITTPKTVAYSISVKSGIRALRRDVFLDDSNDPEDIRDQWGRLLEIAKKKGRAVAQGHPRPNTVEFLETALRDNNEIQIVPLSKLLD